MVIVPQSEVFCAIIRRMQLLFVTLVGKIARAISRIRGGSGSALPGLIVEKLMPRYAEMVLASLPHGVVVVSGTNGKTTTTKMVVELLESQHLRVFTNRTGSNFVRGVIAALLKDTSLGGTLDADIAVLELDEAHAVHFVRRVKPRYSLLLNVMRDQLDRFGEIDTTAGMLKKIAGATTDTVVINREDPRLVDIGTSLQSRAVFYGLSPALRESFPSDDNMRRSTASDTPTLDAVATLESIDEATNVFTLQGRTITTPLALDGIYNIYNATGAMALVSTIAGEKLDVDSLTSALATIRPAFGRGETIYVDEVPIELVLVKNPGGFRLGLASFDPADVTTMIAINDNYADGRDMSWLWDVDFATLRPKGVACVSGVRAYDMALRLFYDDVTVKTVQPDLAKALKRLIAQKRPARIYCTYTAMLSLRKSLQNYTRVEDIG